MHDRLPDGVELEDAPCPHRCPPGDTTVLEGRDRIHGIPGRFRIVSCDTCGLLRTNPRPTGASIGVYYPDSYGPYVSTKPASSRPASAPWKRAVRSWLGLDSRRIPAVTPGSLLEVGCASGAFLQEMRAKGWQVEGIEFSDAAARQARACGLEVQTGSLESAVAPSEPVDLVAAWMVLEHLHDPVHALRRLHEWTKPGGWLVASVPDAGAWLRRAFGERAYDLHLPNHLYHYTPETLSRLLASTGWTVTRVFWQKNCNNLLWSLEYTAADHGWRTARRVIEWLRTEPAAEKLRMALGWMLGVARQSGRIEVWAHRADTIPADA